MIFFNQEAKLENPFTAKMYSKFAKPQSWSIKKKIGLALVLAAGGSYVLRKHIQAKRPLARKSPMRLATCVKLKLSQRQLNTMKDFFEPGKGNMYGIAEWQNGPIKEKLQCSFVGHGDPNYSFEKAFIFNDSENSPFMNKSTSKLRYLIFAYADYNESGDPSVDEDITNIDGFERKLNNFLKYIRTQKFTLSRRMLNDGWKHLKLHGEEVSIFTPEELTNYFKSPEEQAKRFIDLFYIPHGRVQQENVGLAQKLTEAEHEIRQAIKQANHNPKISQP